MQVALAPTPTQGDTSLPISSRSSSAAATRTFLARGEGIVGVALGAVMAEVHCLENRDKNIEVH